MTEHEDLIAEARKAVLTMNYVRAFQGGLVGRLASALEKVTAERDDFESRLSEMLCELTDGLLSKTGYDVQTMVRHVGYAFERAASEEIRDIEAERDAQVAKLSEVINLSKRAGTFGADELGLFKAELRAILNTVPEVSLERVKNEARAEGVREAQAYILRIAPAGLVDRASVLADLEIAAERLSQGIHANGRDRIKKGRSND